MSNLNQLVTDYKTVIIFAINIVPNYFKEKSIFKLNYDKVNYINLKYEDYFKINLNCYDTLRPSLVNLSTDLENLPIFIEDQINIFLNENKNNYTNLLELENMQKYIVMRDLNCLRFLINYFNSTDNKNSTDLLDLLTKKGYTPIIDHIYQSLLNEFMKIK